MEWDVATAGDAKQLVWCDCVVPVRLMSRPEADVHCKAASGRLRRVVGNGAEQLGDVAQGCDR